MTQIDLAVFLVAGLVGCLPIPRISGSVVSWAIVGIWALLKLLKVL